MVFEAVINGDEVETLDPVIRVIIDNGFHRYEFKPEDLKTVEIRQCRKDANHADAS